MKKIAVSVVFTFLCFASFGQKIYFTDTSNIWDFFVVNHGDDVITGYEYVDKYIGDTIFHGINYKILPDRYSGSYSYIREDTLLKQVFIVRPIHDTDTTEMILYDYNWKLGDTFKTTYCSWVVGGFDSTQINGKWHKVWSLSQTDSFQYLFGIVDIIEGIGCTSGPVFDLVPITFSETADYLRCFTNNGTTPVISKTVGFFNNSTSCSSTFGANVGVKNVNNNPNEVKLFPNPFTSNSKLVFAHEINTGTLTIVNAIGQSVIAIGFQDKEEVPIGDLINVPGIYYYRIMDNRNGQSFSGKFVCLK